jgi:hypothetical protein
MFLVGLIRVFICIVNYVSLSFVGHRGYIVFLQVIIRLKEIVKSQQYLKLTELPDTIYQEGVPSLNSPHVTGLPPLRKYYCHQPPIGSCLIQILV